MHVNWPPYVALFQPSTKSAYIMQMLKIEFAQVSVMAGGAITGPIMAFCREYSCDPCHAYYLPKILLKPALGTPLPQGQLSLSVDGATILEEPLSFFLPRPEPPDFLETYPWKTVEGVLPAIVATAEDQADASRQIGIMIPRGSMVEINLRDLVSPEKTRLWIGIPMAKYSTRRPEDEKES